MCWCLRSWPVRGLVVVLPIVFAVHVAQSQVLNEVLYDPANADAGKEFVELYNDSAQAVPLAGVRLEFANGAQPPNWLVRWTGAPGDSIAAGGFFLIGDRGWQGSQPVDAEAPLALQNGPDAIRLVGPGDLIDVLGYGPLEFPELHEGEPAVGGSSGVSLGRKPDGHDTDNNLADWWHLDTPTPGERNFQPWQLAVGAWACEPPNQLMAGHPVLVTFVLDNVGLEVLPATEVQLQAGQQGLVTSLAALQPGSSTTARIDWVPQSAGCRELVLSVPTPGGTSNLVLELGTYRVGIDSVYINEVMAAPQTGCCEWIELGNPQSVSVELNDYLIRDQDGGWRILPEMLLAPGELAILVQDSVAFAEWLSAVSSAGGESECEEVFTAEVRELQSGWPSLNNGAPASRTFADRVLLARPDTTVIDHVVLGAGGDDVAAGRSLERRSELPLGLPAANWDLSRSSLGGTPGCPNSVAASRNAAPELTLEPNPFNVSESGAAGGTPLHIMFSVPPGLAGWDVRIFDLWGRVVRDLGGDRLGSGVRDLIWDGHDDRGETAPAGGYVILLRFLDSEQRPVSGGKKLAVLVATP